MPEQQYVSKIITLTKSFLMRTHAHPLLTEIKGIAIDDDLYIKMWEKTPELSQTSFGETYGTQFHSIEELQSFTAAYNGILLKHNIPLGHGDELLYFIKFLGEDFQKQGLDNNLTNRLLDYTRFLLDLISNCTSHFEAMTKNIDYQMVYDEACQEYFFVRKEYYNNTPIEDIIEYRTGNSPEDIIFYIRVDIYDAELYVPYDLLFSVTSQRKLRAFEGNVLPDIKVPAFLQSQMFKYTLGYMLEEHEKHNTTFYKALKTPGLIDRDFKHFLKQYKKHTVTHSNSMLRVCLVIGDYLKDNSLIKTKSGVTAFLFDYLALFKAIPLKKKVPFPTDYQELSKFYNQQGITKDTIRLMLRDAVIVGGI